MVSACVLYLDDIELAEQKAFVPDVLSALFQETDRVQHGVRYCASRCSVLKRLDLMGCTSALAERRFNEWRDESLRTEMDGLHGEEPVPDVLEAAMLSELRALRELNWADWRARVPNVLHTLYERDETWADEADRRMTELDEGSWLWFDGYDSLISMRAIIDAAEGVRTIALDIGPLIEGGWIEPDTKISRPPARIVSARGQPTGPTVVLAEGRSDIEVLKASLPVFHPDLAESFTFLDHSEFKVDGGVGYVVKFLKAFAAARVPANVVAVLDNDAAGLAAHRQAESLDLPGNMACIHLPDIPLGRAYPTIGPQGNHAADINGRACAIELYLGRTALLQGDGTLRPVVWHGRVEDVYQGEVENKRAVKKAFLAAMRSGCADVERDYPEMVVAWQAIIDAAVRNAEAAQRGSRAPLMR